MLRWTSEVLVAVEASVWMLVEARRLGYSDGELLQRYDPPLTAPELAAAWCYAKRHGEEIEANIRDNQDD